MNSNLSNITITSLIGLVPKNISYYEDEVINYTHSKESSLKLKKLMGYGEHRVVKEPTCISDMAMTAFEHLVSTGFDVATIDALVLVTQTPDYIIPSTSSVLHGLFGLKTDCYCVDINDGCTGYLKGLFESSSIIKSTEADRVLLICGDVLSRRVSKKDRNSYPLVGDAITLSVIDKVELTVTQPLELNYNGTGALALNIPAGGMKLINNEETAKLEVDDEGNVRSREQLVMQGRDVFTFTQTTVSEFLLEFRNKHSDIIPDMYFFHQANSFIIDRLRKVLAINESLLPADVIKKYGNSSSATIPMAMIEHYKEKSLKDVNDWAFLAGFGVGLSWGGLLLNIDKLNYCYLLEEDF